MRSLILLTLLALPVSAQEEEKTWKTFSDTWQRIEKFSPGKELDDEFFRIAAGMHELFGKGNPGALSEAEFGPMKEIFRARLTHIVHKIGTALGPDNMFGGMVRVKVMGGGPGRKEKEKVDLPKELEKLEKSFRGEDFKKAFEGLKKIGSIDKKTPGWKLSRFETVLRAAAEGKAYPALPKADEQTAERIKDLIKRLGAETMDDRDAATRELTDLCPAAVPHLQDAAKNHEDAEVRTRAKAILGIE